MHQGWGVNAIDLPPVRRLAFAAVRIQALATLAVAALSFAAGGWPESVRHCSAQALRG